MKFGKIPLEEIKDIDLPSESVLPNTFKSNASDILKLYTGLSKWGDKSWIGTVYPSNSKLSNLLSSYASIFNTIEINATYYKIFSPDVAKKWVKQVDFNNEFKFILKVPASLSAPGSLKNNYSAILGDYLLFVDALKNHYGGSFLCYTGKASLDALEFFKTILSIWPQDSMLHIELRHYSWFTSVTKEYFTKLVKLLAKKGVGLVMTDTPGRRDVLHLTLTCPHVIIRYVGYDFDTIDKVRLMQWKNKLMEWNKCGLKGVYICIHNSDPAKSMQMADYISL